MNFNKSPFTHTKVPNTTPQNMLLNIIHKVLHKFKRKISSDDQPFFTDKMKKLKKQKSREYRENRKSPKWKELNNKFKKEVSTANKNYYKNTVKELKMTNPSKWYSMLKKMSSYDQHKSEQTIVESIKHLSSKDQCEVIADKFSKVSQEYEPLNKDDIKIPDFDN